MWLHLFAIIKVSGESLSPALHHGDYVLIGTAGIWRRRLRPGDVVVFHHPQYGRMIKRVRSISADAQELIVVGDAPGSVDSLTFGPIPWRAVVGKGLLFFRRVEESGTRNTAE